MIYVMMPAYNEEKMIAEVTDRIAQTLNEASKPFHLIICNDGSTDRTAEELKRLAARYPVTVLEHRPNRGVAEAFRTLFQEAARIAEESDSDMFIMMESDGTSDPSLLVEMIRRIRSGNDVVCASRYRRGGAYVHFPWKRHFLSASANLVLKCLFPIGGVRDYTIFYRAYAARVIRNWWNGYDPAKRIESDGFAANAEILIKMRPFLKSVGEVPLLYRYDLKKGPSKLKIFPTIYGYLVRRGLFFKLFAAKPHKIPAQKPFREPVLNKSI